MICWYFPLRYTQRVSFVVVIIVYVFYICYCFVYSVYVYKGWPILLRCKHVFMCVHTHTHTHVCTHAHTHKTIMLVDCTISLGDLHICSRVLWIIPIFQKNCFQHIGTTTDQKINMGWLRLVGSFKLQISFAKEPYQRDDILQKRPMIFRSLLIVATP